MEQLLRERGTLEDAEGHKLARCAFHMSLALYRILRIS